MRKLGNVPTPVHSRVNIFPYDWFLPNISKIGKFNWLLDNIDNTWDSTKVNNARKPSNVGDSNLQFRICKLEWKDNLSISVISMNLIYNIIEYIFECKSNTE